MYILGVNCYSHDSSVCLIKDGKPIIAIEEERFSREKHTSEFPINALNYCFSETGIKPSQIEHIGYSSKLFIGLPRRVFYFFRYLPDYISQIRRKDRNNKISSWFSMLRLPRLLREKCGNSFTFHFIDHHMAHAASAFLVSPFKESAILTIDGVGEIATTVLAFGKNNSIIPLKRYNYPHSLGFLYGAITQFLGFKSDCDEGKVMGLAAYGKPKYLPAFEKIVWLNSNGEFKLNLKYFNFQRGDSIWFSNKITFLLGPPRKSEEPIKQRHADIAASIQFTLEKAVLNIANQLYKVTKSKNLCIAGGVGLNCLMNSALLKNSPFKNIFIQPAANDGGTSLGCAYYIYNVLLNQPRDYIMKNAFLGSSYIDEEYKRVFRKFNLSYKYHKNISRVSAQLLAQGKIIGWFQGRMEFGPRALGNRSILADPRNAKMKEILNRKVKHRESFRPYAPSILEEKCGEYFSGNCSSPFMLRVYDVLSEKKGKIPGVTHIDGTARIQTVALKENPKFYALIKEFGKITDIPLLLNTSFNLEDKPIVCSPEDAVESFLKSDMDCLVLGNFITEKNG